MLPRWYWSGIVCVCVRERELVSSLCKLGIILRTFKETRHCVVLSCGDVNRNYVIQFVQHSCTINSIECKCTYKCACVYGLFEYPCFVS